MLSNHVVNVVGNMVLDQYWDQTIPVNVEQIAKKIGLSWEEGLISPLMTSTVINDKVVINKTCSRIQKNKEICGIIAQHLLKCKSKYDVDNGWVSIDNEIEQSFEKFAEIVMIPQQALSEIWNNEKVRDVNVLKQRFDVDDVMINNAIKVMLDNQTNTVSNIYKPINKPNKRKSR